MPYIVVEIEIPESITQVNEKVKDTAETNVGIQEIIKTLRGIQAGTQNGQVTIAVKNVATAPVGGSGGKNVTYKKK